MKGEAKAKAMNRPSLAISVQGYAIRDLRVEWVLSLNAHCPNSEVVGRVYINKQVSLVERIIVRWIITQTA